MTSRGNRRVIRGPECTNQHLWTGQLFAPGEILPAG